MKLNEEGITLFQTYSFYDRTALNWVIRIHGWCFRERYQSRRKYIAKKILTKVLGVSSTDWAHPTFIKRMSPFFADDIAQKEVILKFGDIQCQVTSEKTGHFYFETQLSQSEIDTISQDGKIEVTAAFAESLEKQFTITLPVIPEVGSSVISDIDDTIKITKVSEQNSLTKNVLINPYEVVSGMDSLYKKMRNEGTFFHYVSLSPWQLQSPLLEMFQQNELAVDSINLRKFHWKQIRSKESLIGNPNDKFISINQILKDFPQHQFTLIGDVGEIDPEIYAETYRNYPDQIVKILLRNHGDLRGNESRINGLYQDIPEEKWKLFSDPNVI